MKKAIAARLRWLMTNAHLPEVQDEIAQEIRKGTIRVWPSHNGKIQIEPLLGTEEEYPEATGLAV